MLPVDYINYLKIHLKDSSFQSKTETVAKYVLDNYCKGSGTKEFVLLGIGEGKFSQYHVRVTTYKSKPKLHIDSAKKLTELSEVEPCKHATLYVYDTGKTQNTDDKKLKSDLESKFAEIVQVSKAIFGAHNNGDKLPHEKYPIRWDVYIPNSAQKCNLAVMTPISLWNLILTKLKAQPVITVPLVPETLDSEVVDGLKWGDFIPKDAAPDCEIAGVPVYYVVPDADIDAYQNIFLTFYGPDRSTPLCRFLAVNALNADVDKFSQKQRPVSPSPAKSKAPSSKPKPAHAPTLAPESPTQTPSATLTVAPGNSNTQMYNSCTRKISKGSYHNVEDLFKEHIVSRGGTSVVEFRDGYLYKNWALLKNFMERIFGISQQAHSDNSEIKVITKFSVMIKDMSADEKVKDKFNKFIENFEKYKLKIKKSDDIEISYGFMTAEDAEGAHARSLILVDNGWQIDFDGGLDFLYINAKAVNSGKCERNTRLTYIDLLSPVSK